MGKKRKLSIRQDDALRTIDDDLESALQHLEGANRKVRELLESFAPEESTAPDDPAQQGEAEHSPDTAPGDAEPQPREEA